MDTQNETEKVASKTKNWFARNKTKILATALVATTTYAVVVGRNKREFDRFLTEEGLLTKFYCPEMYAELEQKAQ